MTKNAHIHKLKRLKYKSGNTIFFCSLPDCTFKTNIALALGKRSLCWRCGESFIMSEYALRLAKPHCDQCHRPKGSEVPWIHESSETEKEAIKELMDSPLVKSFFPPKFLPAEQEPSLAEKMQMELHKAQEKEEEL